MGRTFSHSIYLIAMTVMMLRKVSTFKKMRPLWCVDDSMKRPAYRGNTELELIELEMVSR